MRTFFVVLNTLSGYAEITTERKTPYIADFLDYNCASFFANGYDTCRQKWLESQLKTTHEIPHVHSTKHRVGDFVYVIRENSHYNTKTKLHINTFKPQRTLITEFSIVTNATGTKILYEVSPHEYSSYIEEESGIFLTEESAELECVKRRTLEK
jgi:hypothetical protein